LAGRFHLADAPRFICYDKPMEIISEIIASSVRVFREAALYILFGLMIAGIMRIYLRPESVAHYFHRGRFRSVLFAGLLGIPLPL
jgi:uncharacterized protein